MCSAEEVSLTPSQSKLHLLALRLADECDVLAELLSYTAYIRELLGLLQSADVMPLR